MGDVISSMTGAELIGFVAVVGGIASITMTALAAIIIPLVTWARRTEANTQLKRDLAATGFSAQDIERVVRASPDGPPPTRS